MIKKAKYLFIIFSILLLSTTIPYFISYKDLKNKITSEINKIPNLNIQIDGKIKKHFLPSSSIVINEIKIQTAGLNKKESLIADIKKVKINLGFFSRKISNIEIYSPKISYLLTKPYPNQKNDVEILEYINELSNDIIKEDIAISLENGTFIIAEGNYQYLELNTIKLDSDYNLDRNFLNMDLNLLFQGIKVKNHIKFDKKIDILVKSDILDLEITMDNNNFLLFDKKNAKGVIKSTIKNLSLIAELILPLSNTGRIFNAKHNPINILLDLKENNNHISIENGSIISDIINGKIEGEIAKNHITTNNHLLINIANLKLLDLFNTQKASLKKVYKTEEKIKINKIKNKYDININFDDVYVGDKNIKDLKINIKNNKDKLAIKSNMVKIGDYELKIEGNILINFRNFLFDGLIESKGKNFSNIFKYILGELGIYNNIKSNFTNKQNYNLSSKILLTPYSISAKNSQVTIEDKKISGAIKFDNSNPDKRIEGNLIFDNFIIKNQKRNGISLIDKSFKLTTINHYYKLLFEFRNANFYDYLISNIKFNLLIEQNYLNLDNITLKSPKINLNSNLNITLDKEPKLELTIDAENVNFNKYEDLASVFFAIPSIKDFLSNIYISINNLKIGNLETKNIKIISDIKQDATLNIIHNDMQAYDGVFNHETTIILDRMKSINSKFKIINADLQKILTDVINIKKVKSNFMNLAGYCLARGISKKEFAKNSNCALNFNAKDIEIENFGLINIKDKLSNIKNTKESTININQILENNTSQLNNLEGTITIDSKKQHNTLSATIKSYDIVGSLSSNFNISEKTFSVLSKFKFYVNGGKKAISLLLATKLNEIQKIHNTNQIDHYLKILHEALSKKTYN